MCFPSGNLPSPIVHRTTNQTSQFLAGERGALVSRWNNEAPGHRTKLTVEFSEKGLDSGGRRTQGSLSFEFVSPVLPTSPSPIYSIDTL
jgi:hypothetical protein